MCVHPYRVGLPPGRYACAGTRHCRRRQRRRCRSLRPGALELPERLDDLERWLVAVPGDMTKPTSAYPATRRTSSTRPVSEASEQA